MLVHFDLLACKTRERLSVPDRSEYQLKIMFFLCQLGKVGLFSTLLLLLLLGELGGALQPLENLVYSRRL